MFAPRKRHHRRRRHNRIRRHNRSYRRRNPFGVSNVSGLVKDVLYAGAGAVGTRLIPNLLLKDSNTGIMGYAANAATAVALGFIAEKIGGPAAQQNVLIGGGVAIVARVFEDYLGSSLSAYTVPQGLLGVGAYGDSAYDLKGMGGVYTPSYFSVPTISGPNLSTSPPVAPTVQQVKAVTNMSGMGKYSGRYGGNRYSN